MHVEVDDGIQRGPETHGEGVTKYFALRFSRHCANSHHGGGYKLRCHAIAVTVYSILVALAKSVLLSIAAVVFSVPLLYAVAITTNELSR